MTDLNTSTSLMANTQSTFDADERKGKVRIPEVKLGSPVLSMKQKLAKLSNYGGFSSYNSTPSFIDFNPKMKKSLNKFHPHPPQTTMYKNFSSKRRQTEQCHQHEVSLLDLVKQHTRNPEQVRAATSPAIDIDLRIIDEIPDPNDDEQIRLLEYNHN